MEESTGVLVWGGCYIRGVCFLPGYTAWLYKICGEFNERQGQGRKALMLARVDRASLNSLSASCPTAKMSKLNNFVVYRRTARQRMFLTLHCSLVPLCTEI